MAHTAIPPVWITSRSAQPYEERDGGMVGVAQVHVLAAGEGPLPGKVGIDEGADQRRGAAQDPRPQHLRAGLRRRGHDGGSDEDAGADDAAHHHHGRVEESDPAGEAVFSHPALHHGSAMRKAERNDCPRRPRPASTKNA